MSARTNPARECFPHVDANATTPESVLPEAIIWQDPNNRVDPSCFHFHVFELVPVCNVD